MRFLVLQASDPVALFDHAHAVPLVDLFVDFFRHRFDGFAESIAFCVPASVDFADVAVIIFKPLALLFVCHAGDAGDVRVVHDVLVEVLIFVFRSDADPEIAIVVQLERSVVGHPEVEHFFSSELFHDILSFLLREFILFLSLSVIILYHGTRGKSRVFSKKFEKIFLPSITKKANPNRVLLHFLPHFCRTFALCRTPAAVFLHPNAPKILFEKRYKKCKFIAIYRSKPALSKIGR
nr:MAG TPA: hypothetical protein [Caudoviricetes sp.]